ncbi:MAG TPA: hypothetical protein VM717_11425 [Chthoniobacterales bacterium]|nr:hypothetical protein [Chthoniobacterales bacterium]
MSNLVMEKMSIWISFGIAIVFVVAVVAFRELALVQANANRS